MIDSIRQRETVGAGNQNSFKLIEIQIGDANSFDSPKPAHSHMASLAIQKLLGYVIRDFLEEARGLRLNLTVIRVIEAYRRCCVQACKDRSCGKISPYLIGV